MKKYPSDACVVLRGEVTKQPRPERREAPRSCKHTPVDLAIFDVKLPGSGLEVWVVAQGRSTGYGARCHQRGATVHDAVTATVRAADFFEPLNRERVPVSVQT
jgi:hypothetical protein